MGKLHPSVMGKLLQAGLRGCQCLGQGQSWAAASAQNRKLSIILVLSHKCDWRWIALPVAVVWAQL